MDGHKPTSYHHGQRTFGCEFEWCVAFHWEDVVKLCSGDTAKIISVPTEIRDEIPSYIDDAKRHQYGFEYVLADIRQTLQDHGYPLQQPIKTNIFKNNGEYQLLPYQGWTVTTDSTIKPQQDSEWYWCPVEIASPAEITSDEAFAAIRNVVDLLKSRYRMSVNPSCGFHVHVGQGADFLDLGALRRVAGILWAADPLLACLHPPERHFNYWAQSIRDRSVLAMWGGDTGGAHHPVGHGVLGRCIEREVRRGETPSDYEMLHGIEARLTEHPSNTPSSSDAPAHSIANTPYKGSRKRDGPRMPLPRYTAENEARLTKVSDYGSKDRYLLRPRAPTDFGVFPGAHKIFCCPRSCTLPWLLEAYGQSRPNYSFHAYSCLRLSNAQSHPRTVEFREAASTTSSAWAETWARICVGIYDWAVRAPVDEYLAVLDNCDRAAKGSGEYDVVDLLDQIGLSAESAIAETRLKNRALWE